MPTPAPAVLPVVANPAAEAGPEVELPGVQGIEILAQHGEKPPKMGFRAGRIRVELDLRRLGLHKSAATHKQKSPAFCGLPRQTWSKRPSITVQRVGLKAIIIGRLR